MQIIEGRHEATIGRLGAAVRSVGNLDNHRVAAVVALRELFLNNRRLSVAGVVLAVVVFWWLGL